MLKAAALADETRSVGPAGLARVAVVLALLEFDGLAFAHVVDPPPVTADVWKNTSSDSPSGRMKPKPRSFARRLKKILSCCHVLLFLLAR